MKQQALLAPALLLMPASMGTMQRQPLRSTNMLSRLHSKESLNRASLAVQRSKGRTVMYERRMCASTANKEKSLHLTPHQNPTPERSRSEDRAVMWRWQRTMRYVPLLILGVSGRRIESISSYLVLQCSWSHMSIVEKMAFLRPWDWSQQSVSLLSLSFWIGTKLPKRICT